MNVAVAGYVFTPMMAFDASDTYNTAPGSSVAEFAAACNSDAACVGFDSLGELQYVLLPFDQWITWDDDPCLGFYTKNVSV